MAFVSIAVIRLTGFDGHTRIVAQAGALLCAIAAGIDCFAEAWESPEPGARMAHFLASKRRG